MSTVSAIGLILAAAILKRLEADGHLDTEQRSAAFSTLWAE